ncbi:TnsA-like heteromeric transposase endonuclease subunit [Streptomyces sp. TE33382]
MSIRSVIDSATVQTRPVGKGEVEESNFREAHLGQLLDAGPWRTFRWHLGQQHYSGTYWSATEHGHVIYESRLELARLLYADFDADVLRIIAQPFLMTARVDGAVRRHIPDFLLLTGSGPVVVDVKPARRLSHPDVAFTFRWSREVIESRGWGYQVWSEPSAVELENLRFLAGYRRGWLFDPVLVEALGQAKAGRRIRAEDIKVEAGVTGVTCRGGGRRGRRRPGRRLRDGQGTSPSQTHGPPGQLMADNAGGKPPGATGARQAAAYRCQ